MLPDRGEDILSLPQFSGNCRGERDILEIRPVQRHQLHEIRHSDRMDDRVDHLGRNPQFLLQHMAYSIVHAAFCLNPNRFTLCTLSHNLFDRCQEVGGFINLDLEIRVTGNPEGKRCHNFQSGKEHVEMGGYDLFKVDQVDIGILGASCCILARDPDKAREEVGRDLDPGEILLLCRVADDNGKVEGKVGDEREWV